jgi:succinate dehydrogenase/fumarate reductase cytochrome b subunit
MRLRRHSGIRGWAWACLCGWIFSFFYHLCNGMRHLFWDIGLGFNLGTIYTSG